MDFQWFETVTWSSIKDLRGTKHVRPPPRFKFALQQAQHATLRAIIHHGRSSFASEPAWKVLALSRWLLVGRPAVRVSESNCAHFLEARLDLFWAEDWPALCVMVRAECDVAPVSSSARKTATEQKQSRIRKVATLARSCERGCALAAARNAQPVPVSRLYKRSTVSTTAHPDRAVPAQTPVSILFVSKVADLVPAILRKMPSANLARLACALSTGTTLESKLETVTRLCKLLRILQLLQSRARFCSTSDLAKSRHSPKATGGPQAASHEVFRPQAGSQVSHGGQEGVSGHVCWTSPTWRRTPGRFNTMIKTIQCLAEADSA